MNDVLLFTGNSGAGKSTLARLTAEHFDAIHLSEREVSRGLAAENGFHRSRAWVEEIGLEKAAVEIRKRTVQRIGDFDENLVLIDGAYDRLLPPEIQYEYTSRRLGIIAVEAAATTRVDRCAQRMGGVALSEAAKDVEYLDDVKRRIGGSELIAMADLTIVNEGSLEESMERVVHFIERRL